MNLDPLTDFILDAKQRSEGSQGLEPQDFEFLHREGCYLDALFCRLSNQIVGACWGRVCKLPK